MKDLVILVKRFVSYIFLYFNFAVIYLLYHHPNALYIKKKKKLMKIKKELDLIFFIKVTKSTQFSLCNFLKFSHLMKKRNNS